MAGADAGASFSPLGSAISAAAQLAGAALGGPPPSSNAYGGTQSTGGNTVTYNKGPDWRLIGAGVLVVGLVWLWKRKK